MEEGYLGVEVNQSRCLSIDFLGPMKVTAETRSYTKFMSQ